jgi:hypothetical protein
MTASPSGDELRLTISPHGHIEWCGPRAKLEASGLIPPGFKWPTRIDYAHWHAAGFDFMLRRCRPDGFMGPMRHWMNYDYWWVRRFVPCNPLHPWFTRQVYRDLGDILFQATRLGEALRLHFSKVHADERIERLEAGLVPQPTKRGRGAKGG